MPFAMPAALGHTGGDCEPRLSWPVTMKDGRRDAAGGQASDRPPSMREAVMITSRTRRIVVGLGLLLVVPSIGRGAGPEDKDVGGLKREVAERERTVTRAERALAEARAHLALAEGKRDQAAAELRKAVAGWEA